MTVADDKPFTRISHCEWCLTAQHDRLAEQPEAFHRPDAWYELIDPYSGPHLFCRYPCLLAWILKQGTFG